MTLRLLTVLGTRPELVKLAPVIPLFDAHPGVRQRILHTGQHYSLDMDAIFFRELDLRAPDVALQVGSASHAVQTGAILAGVERALLDEKADGVLVLGDTNSTLGGAVAAAKLGVPVVHIEAGCRSFLRDQPEEINRVLVDHCATHLLAPDETARQNLLREGLSEAAIAVVGSTSIDAALRLVGAARGRPIVAEVRARLGVGAGGGPGDPGDLLLCTVHRAENTTPAVLRRVLDELTRISEHHPIAFPVHPRTRAVMEHNGLSAGPRVLLLPPLGYLDLLALLGSCRALLTDSGGLQEEAAAVGTPALVLRNETEWSYLIDAGRNALVGNGDDLSARALALLDDESNRRMRATPCDLGTTIDPQTGALRGSAAPRIVAEVVARL